MAGVSARVVTKAILKLIGPGGTLSDSTIAIRSVPPTNKCKVTNLYVDPNTGKLVIEYDNNPV